MPRSYSPLALVALAATSFLTARPATAQLPLGAEFRVNVFTIGNQLFPQAAAAADGHSLVVWQDEGTAVVARAYDASGVPQGGDKAVSLPGPSVFRPAVAAHPAGFIVVWGDFGSDGSGSGAFGRLLDVAGNATGLPFRLNTYTTGEQSWARVASDAAGNFVAVWNSIGQDGSYEGIFGRRFDAAGAPRGAEFQVNTFTPGSQWPAVLAMAPDGRFVVAWQNQVARIEARRYDAQGNPFGLSFQVAPGTIFQAYPAVAVRPDGGFVVAWDSHNQDSPGSYGVQARLFDPAGVARGAEFRVNEVVALDQRRPSLCADADGNFVVAWESGAQDGSGVGVFARRLTASGTPMGGEFRVNTYTAGDQLRPAIACDPDGNVVVSWFSLGQGDDLLGVYAQRLGRFDPASLGVDAKIGNGVFEPGETVEAATGWRNFTHQSFNPVTGAASAFTGPAGATYTIVDGAASYGDVGAGQGATCELFEDCFAFSVSAPPTRPATHWDARFTETLNIGRAQTWTLHIGASFTDVPVTSQFYRFVETVLHNGVTGGCQGASYCPAAATLREQMPVMVLVAREGAGYQPPACQPGSELFADVPASSPFCRWVEELSRRGVVSGCAQNTYCPGAPVSREQMAVFVLATLEAPGYVPPACTTPVFGDVPASSPFCRWIEELARRGVVGGCGNGNYCPAAAVSREQVAVFVAQGFGLTLYGP